MCNVYIIENRDKINETIVRLSEKCNKTNGIRLSIDERKELCDFWDALFDRTKFDELGLDNGNLNIVSNSLIRSYNQLANGYTLTANYNLDGSIEVSLSKCNLENGEMLENKASISDVSKITEEILNDIFDKFNKAAEEDNIYAVESSNDGLVKIEVDYFNKAYKKH